MPKRLGERILFESRIFCVKEVDLELSSGKRVSYEFLDWGNSVMAVPLVSRDTLLLVKEYHAAVGEYQLGLCKGALDKGKDPKEVMNKELQEEIGYRAKRLDELAILTSSPGYSTQKTHIFLARDLVKSKLEGDEAEELEVVPCPFSKFEELIDKGELSEARMITALYLAKRFLKNNQESLSNI
ncbi:MAG: ADP compounds hydrolase NudE [Candidatus Portnoybacteria bacterium]|nr:ADP compounds hydrolase NudE [Candidatus Portnoybacteria bacterium]